MKNSKYNNLFVFYPEVKSVWKSPEQTATEFSINFWITQWISRNLTSVGVKHPKEFLTEPRWLCFIPYITSDNIFFDFRKKTYSVCHFLFSILALSSSRDKRLPGSDLYLLSLLSNSFLWLWGTGTLDSSEAMLSHRSSTNRIFSGALKLASDKIIKINPSKTLVWANLHLVLLKTTPEIKNTFFTLVSSAYTDSDINRNVHFYLS